MDYWVPGVDVAGVHELVANALIIKGEKKRTMAQTFANMFTPYFSCTYLTAFALGNPPFILNSISSEAFSPEPLPQQNVFSLRVFSGIS